MSDRLVAWLVFAVALAALMLGARTQGNTRDEGYYFEAGEQYFGWYAELGDNLIHGHPQRSFHRASVDRWFSYNHEHPALMKTLFGASERLFNKALRVLSPEAALRLPTQVAVAFMAALIYLFGAQAWSRRAGLVAAVLSVAAPRLFFDAQLACFDAPIAALWVATVYAYWRSFADGKWAWRAGLLFGLALATKHNAFFIPVILVPHYLWTQRATLLKLRFPRIPAALVWMALLGPVVYLACWPWLWFDTVLRFREYVAFHVNHVYYNMEYFGHNYNKPPFPISFPYVMTFLTLPVTTLALAIGGAVVLARKKPAATAPGLLVGLNALFPMAIITVTRAPIFGATKHWHAAIPFLALLAGYGFHALTDALGPLFPRFNERRRQALVLALGLVVCTPAVAETWRSHPYALTHYNLLAGGPQGGADLGMNRQFWGYSTRGLMPWLNAHAQPNAPIYWHDTNQSQLNMDVRTGVLRPDLRNTGLEEPGVQASDLAMVIHEKHFNKYEYWIWDFYGTARPSVVLDDEGVPIVTLYERPTTSKTKLR